MDYERLAENTLDANASAYIAGGAGDEATLRWNREAFQDYAILPRILAGPETPSTTIEMLGQQLPHPIIVAPLAYQKLAHPDGEKATALAAAAQDTLMVLSTLASTSIEEAARVEGQACRWFQLYLQEHRDDTLALVRRAENAGHLAIILTVDAPLSGVRNREQRIGFKLPNGIRAVNLGRDLGQHPSRSNADIASAVFQEYLRIAPSWRDLEWLIANTSLPVVVKGVASPFDAKIAIESGARGIIVSNHGGRTLDTIPATIHLLPPIVDVVRQRVPILIDGGVRRGTDVFKCLALGASAVMIGRPILHGLAVAGARGVSHVLRILRDEFEIAMVLAGATRISQISDDRILRLARGPIASG